MVVSKGTNEVDSKNRCANRIWLTLLLISLILSLACGPTSGQPSTRKEPAAETLEENTRDYIKLEAPVIALMHASVIDGTGAPIRNDQTVVIEAGTIKSIGNANRISIPTDAKVLDLRGYTLIPGLVGMHDHLFYAVDGGKQFATMSQSFPKLYLGCGVTTIRTGGSTDWAGDLKIKKLIDEGKRPGPKVHLTSPYLNGNVGGAPDPDKAANAVDRWANEGATSFKAYTGLRLSELAAVVEAAHKRGLKVTGHLGAVGFSDAAAAGIDNLEHGLLVDTEFYSSKMPDNMPDWMSCLQELTHTNVSDSRVKHLISALVRRHVAITSTLSIFESLTGDGFPIEQRVLDALCSEAHDNFLDKRRQTTAQTREMWKALVGIEMRFEREFVRAGGHLMTGVDPTGWGGVLAGFGDQRNLELLVEAGFKSEEAIRIATSNGAAFLGLASQIGTLTTGKRADIVVIRGDPSRNIADIKNVEIVFKDGIGYDSIKLIQSVRNQVGER